MDNEDDEVIRQQVKKMLEQWGYQVVLVEDFMEVLSIFVSRTPLGSCDIGFTLYSTGYHWCQEIRKVSRCLLCSCLPESGLDIVMAINMGGDDFWLNLLTKMFS